METPVPRVRKNVGGRPLSHVNPNLNGNLNASARIVLKNLPFAELREIWNPHDARKYRDLKLAH